MIKRRFSASFISSGTLFQSLEAELQRLCPLSFEAWTLGQTKDQPNFVKTHKTLFQILEETPKFPKISNMSDWIWQTSQIFPFQRMVQPLKTQFKVTLEETKGKTVC